MTNERFWQDVGHALYVRRVERGWESREKLKLERADAPNERTTAAIESGRPGHVKKLNDYCEVLGVQLVDVLQSVLPNAGVSAEGLQMGRAFDAADPQMRQAIRLLLQAPPTRRGGETSARGKIDGGTGRRRTKA